MISARLGVRLIGFFFIVLGIWQGLANLLSAYREFDPTYAGYFFSQELLRPLVAIGVGLAVMLLSKPLGRFVQGRSTDTDA